MEWRPWKREIIEREVVVTPLEGTNMSLFHSIIPNWWTANGLSGGQFYGTASLADQVWVCNRCQQLNSQQIASMPLRWYGPPSAQEPMWVSNPDPNVFPNGIGDALFAIVWQLYAWGYSLQYITDFYADGFPRSWTVIPSSACEPFYEDGQRIYKLGEQRLDPERVVQIDRNPTTAAHGTSALRPYAQNAWQLLAAGNQAMTVSQGGIPQSVLKSQRKLTKEQAEALQEQWMTATSSRNGAPPVLPPELDFTTLSYNPSDLSLLDTQEWNARVLATAYGIPSVILNMALQGGLTYQNPIALMQMWWLTELRTTSKRIMDAFTAQMLPSGQWVAQDATDITTEGSIEGEDDPQGSLVPNEPNTPLRPSQVAKASPAQQPRLQAIGGSSP